MEKFTLQKPDGEWFFYTYDIREVPKALYGAICKRIGTGASDK